jgi:hypothetical protein
MCCLPLWRAMSLPDPVTRMRLAADCGSSTWHAKSKVSEVQGVRCCQLACACDADALAAESGNGSSRGSSNHGTLKAEIVVCQR